jgi:hypothetical protein
MAPCDEKAAINQHPGRDKAESCAVAITPVDAVAQSAVSVLAIAQP